METLIYIGLGTNQGDRLDNLSRAVAALPPNVSPLRLSSVYETPPWGYLDQPTFLNQVLEAKTSLNPSDLLEYLKHIEEQVGRKPTFLYGPRVIDLDILFYDELILDKPGLTIPHPFLHLRAFVLVPLVELMPDLYHPVFDKPVSELLASVDTVGIKRYIPNSLH